MNTCEQCGADAVDARGICRNCGWQARLGIFIEADDTPSLGETRAADIPPGGYAASSPAAQSTRNARMNQYPTDARPTALVGGGATSGGRFCGSCGARIENGVAFCGQCGSPIAASATNALTYGSNGLRPPEQERYRVGGWSDGDGNDPTEAIPGATGYSGFGRSGAGPGLPYGGAPYHPTGYMQSRSSTANAGSSHTMRLIVGVLCIIGSIVSASSAIILAITMGH